MNKAPHDRTIDYIEFATTDIEASKAFFSEAFGWSFVDYGPGYAAFHDGRLDGGFFKADEVAPGTTLCVLYALDLEASEAKVVAAGGEVVREAFSFPGGRRFHFKEPGGNILALWTEA